MGFTVGVGLLQYLTGPKPKEIKVETFRIDYLIRTPRVEKLSLQPIRYLERAPDLKPPNPKSLLLSDPEV